jgi:hypothetical protein
MAANHLLSWDSHLWTSREVNLPGGVRATQFTCNRCARHFIEEPTGVRYAVHVGMLNFDRLSDEVTSRWLYGQCADRPLDTDLADLQTRAEQSTRKSPRYPESAEPEES